MKSEVKHIDGTKFIMMKPVPIIGVAVCDGTVERKYLEKLEELECSGRPERLTADQVEQIHSRIMR